MKHLFCLGFGFSAQHLAKILSRDEWRFSGTSRKPSGVTEMQSQGVEGYLFDSLDHIPTDATHVFSSIAPDEHGDPALRKFGHDLKRKHEWIGYLSTTGLYGDRQGDWIDEETPANPMSTRARRRLLPEQQWQSLGAHIFRLPGIYGPGRSQLDSVKDGTARRVIKPGHVFCRIHVEDIAGAVAASMGKPNPGRIYNVADDEAAPPQDVVTYAAQLLNRPPPPEEHYETAKLSPMAASFYDECKRVSNRRLKEELGYKLKYPTYREGLKALLP